MQPVGCTPWCSMNATRRLLFVVHAAGWLHSMVLYGRHEKAPVCCPCSRLVALHGALWTPREGSSLLSMQPVGYTPWCSMDATRRLQFVVHAAGWLHSMVLYGRHEKAPVCCPCSRLVTLHGALWTPREGSSLLSMQPVGCTPWCSMDA